jgi:hypothetical protein
MANNLILIKEPSVTVEDSQSYFLGVHKPIVFEFYRQDLKEITYSNDGGFLKCTATETVNNTFGALDVGDVIWVVFQEEADAKSKVLSVKLASITNKIDANNIVVDIIYSVIGDMFGFVNFIRVNDIYERENWFLETKINNEITIESKADTNFKISVNVAPFLQSLMDMKDSYTTEPVQGKAIIEMFEDFDLSFKFYWSLANLVPEKDFTLETYTALNGVKQNLEKYGNNFFEYVGLFSEIERTILSKLFIAENPTYFVGLPFYYYFIQEEGELDFEVLNQIVQVDSFDNSNTLIGTQEIDLNTDEKFRVCTINDTIALEETGVKKLKIKHFWKSDTPTLYRCSKEYTIDIEQGCGSVYLNWLASNGSRYFWLFETRSINGISVKTESEVMPYFENIETQNYNIRETSKSAYNTVTVGTFVPKSKFEWIKTILHSINVNILTNPETWQDDGCVWQIVRVEDGNYPLGASDDEILNFEVTFKLPNINIQGE